MTFKIGDKVETILQYSTPGKGGKCKDTIDLWLPGTITSLQPTGYGVTLQDQQEYSVFYGHIRVPWNYQETPDASQD